MNTATERTLATTFRGIVDTARAVITGGFAARRKHLIDPIPEPQAGCEATGAEDVGARWYPPGSAPTVHGYTVGGGMFYIRTRPNTPGFSCLVDPSLAVGALGEAESDGQNHHLSYSAMSPAGRLEYLRWLAAGKCDPFTATTNVALYINGLERRILVDRADVPERNFLAAELTRLLSVYHGFGSVRHHLARLLEATEIISVLRGDRDAPTFEPDLSVPPGTMPLRLKLVLALALASPVRSRLGFDLAVGGMLGMSHEAAPELAFMQSYPRRPFLDLLRERFELAFPDGFRPGRTTTSRLTLVYSLASESGQIDLVSFADACELSDPCKVDWAPMLVMAEQVGKELTGAVKTTRAKLTLADRQATQVQIITPQKSAPTLEAKVDPRPWLSSLRKPIAVVPLGELARNVLGGYAAPWRPVNHAELLVALNAAGHGMEPEEIRDGSVLEECAEILILTGHGCLDRRTPQFASAASAAALFTEIAAAAGDRARRIEADWLESAIPAFGLPPGETLRLAAQLHWMRDRLPSHEEAQRIASGLQIDQRDLVGRLAVAAASKGDINAPQLALLERLYDRLGVSRRGLYSLVQRATIATAVPADEPVVVEAPKAAVVAYSIPEEPKPSPSVKVRKSKVVREKARSVRQDTERVVSILKDVFVEEEAVGPATKPLRAGRFRGLDVAHGEMLTQLIERGSWDRREFSEAARELGLMPDGVLEVLNEWAFENYGDAVADDGDPVVAQSVIIDGMKDIIDATE